MPVNGEYVSDSIGAGTTTFNAANGVLANDTDPYADTLSVTGVSDTANGPGTLGQPLTGAYGKLTLNADGSSSYDLTSTPTTAVQDIFTYTVSDGKGGTAPATVTCFRPTRLRTLIRLQSWKGRPLPQQRQPRGCSATTPSPTTPIR